MTVEKLNKYFGKHLLEADFDKHQNFHKHAYTKDVNSIKVQKIRWQEESTPVSFIDSMKTKCSSFNTKVELDA